MRLLHLNHANQARPGSRTACRRRGSVLTVLVVPAIVSAYCASDPPNPVVDTASRGQGLNQTLTDCMPSSLVSAIAAANAAGAGSHNIALANDCQYKLTVPNNYYYGANGLPAITSDRSDFRRIAAPKTLLPSATPRSVSGRMSCSITSSSRPARVWVLTPEV